MSEHTVTEWGVRYVSDRIGEWVELVGQGEDSERAARALAALDGAPGLTRTLVSRQVTYVRWEDVP